MGDVLGLEALVTDGEVLDGGDRENESEVVGHHRGYQCSASERVGDGDDAIHEKGVEENYVIQEGDTLVFQGAWECVNSVFLLDGVVPATTEISKVWGLLKSFHLHLFPSLCLSL